MYDSDTTEASLATRRGFDGCAGNTVDAGSAGTSRLWRGGHLVLRHQQAVQLCPVEDKGIWREVTPPGASTIHYGNQPAGMWISGVHQGVYGGGYWDILSSNDTDTVYTKGYCQNFG